LLDAAELLQIQQDAYQATCDLPCIIQRGTRTPNPQGGASVTFATIATVNAGMAQPSGTQLQNYGYLVDALSAWQIKLAVGTDVKNGDRLIIAGQTLFVQVVLSPRSYAALLTVIASEVK
jgi:hypothetical protein